ncbi:MAG: AAA family ATPase [Spirochaetaceae bacterium]
MIRDRIRTLLETMEEGVYEREEAMRLAFLAAAAAESVFFLGPPGVAKSLIARRVKFAFRDATSFEYLMSRFSTPDEIFGPISIQRLKEEDRYERITDRYLPDADIVFLDEIWKAGPPIQNALLTALNEKRFRNGAQELRIPMKGLISASNHIPETDAGQRAFWDRFLIRVPLGPIERDENFHRLLTDSSDEYADTVPVELKVDAGEYARWQAGIEEVTLPQAVLESLSRLRRRLAAPGERDGHQAMSISDRRWKKVARLLRTSAYLNGREEVGVLDLGLLRHCLWDRPEDIDVVRTLVSEELARFSFGESVDPRVVARELGSLKRRIRDATLETVEEETYEPVLYRGEYVRLEGFEEAGAALMWRGDFEALPTDGGARCELFLFNEDMSFSETRSYDDVKRCEEPAVRMNGTRYAVEHRKAWSTTARERKPAPEERDGWRAEADALAERCAEAVELSVAMYHEGLAEPHLFVEREFGEIAYAGLAVAADEFEQLRLTAARLADQLRHED